MSREQPWEDENGSGRESPSPPPRLSADSSHGPLTPPLQCFSAEWRPRCQLHGPSCLHRDSAKGPQAIEKGLAHPDGASHVDTGLGILGTPTSPQGIQSLQLLLRLRGHSLLEPHPEASVSLTVGWALNAPLSTGWRGRIGGMTGSAGSHRPTAAAVTGVHGICKARGSTLA